MGGRRILIDPVFSAYASPLPFVIQAFDGTTIYTPDDIPDIDYLFITHDHWDHLDYASVKALQPKVGNVVTGLGVGTYFEQWGYAPAQVQEADWYTKLELEAGFTVHVLPSRHYSGRLLTRNRTTLWAGFALKSSTRRIFFSGDSGYGPHFLEIGQKLGGFDLVVLDSGQYDERWAYIHMNPEEAVQAARDLNSKALLPAHIGRFKLANHPRDEPFKRLAAASEGNSHRLLTPIIGEPVRLGDKTQKFSHWWEAGQQLLRNQ